MKSINFLAIVLLVSFLFTGCLTSEYKEYLYEFTGKNTGKLTIKFVNIMSKKDKSELSKDEENDKDFNELMDNYLKGEEMEKKYPNAKLISKRLFEENAKLCGEIVLEFKDISDVQLFKYDKKGPFMFYLQSLSSETFDKSNGTKGPDYMPVIFWEKGLKKLSLQTKITEPGEETTSLLDKWKNK